MPKTPARVAQHPPAMPPTHGISARELLERGGNLRRLAADDLEAWLLEAGLAERDGGPGCSSRPRAGAELGAALSDEPILGPSTS